MRLEDRVEQYVATVLREYQHPPEVRDAKAIHEPLLGTNIFYRHEVAVLDTPLLQRLRYIRQTGLAFLTFPSATHSRFEHTLGVTVLATRFARRINESIARKEGEGTQVPEEISDTPKGGEMAEIRMAALLHDCGHAFLSHTSENIYDTHRDITELQNRDNRFAKCEPHEILSYLIVRSASFEEFFKDNVLNRYSVDMKLDTVANMIIGYIHDRNRAFITQIINGPFDADKLDYIARDGYFSGLQLVIDIDSLFYRLSVRWLDKEKMWSITPESPNPGQQILFSKMLLLSTVYNHQKVRASDCMVQALAEYVKKKRTTFRGSHLNNPVDFLMFTDSDIFSRSGGTNDPFIKQIIVNLRQRNLFKRALVICKATVDNWDRSRQYELTSLNESPSDLMKLRLEILNRIPATQRPSIHELWLDIPDLPESHEEATQTYVCIAGGRPVALQELFPLDGWMKAYSDQQWRSHVFCPREFQVPVNEAATAVLREYGLELNDKSRIYCHL